MDETTRSCRDFTAALASAAPTPGGGGAAALVGAVGAALGCMVANLTVGKPRYAAHETEVQSALQTLDALRVQLLDLVKQDADGFAPLASAYRLPQGDPVREAATLSACAAPMAMMRACRSALDAVQVLAVYGAVSMRSDAACAASCLRAALECASLNVRVNTAELTDRAAAEKLNAEVQTLWTDGAAKAAEIIAVCFG